MIPVDMYLTEQENVIIIKGAKRLANTKYFWLKTVQESQGDFMFCSSERTETDTKDTSTHSTHLRVGQSKVCHKLSFTEREKKTSLLNAGDKDLLS